MPQPGAPLVDLQTGYIAPVWYRLLVDLWNRTSGGIVLAGPATLGTSVAALYTAPAGVKAVVVRAAVFTNTSGSARTFTVYVVRSGGSPGAGNIVINAQSVAAGAAYVSSELANLVLGAGDSVQALASATSSINAVLSGAQSS